MGKKKDKKVKGAEKTQKKTEKNLDKKAKKDLRVKGEEDIEAIISQIEEQDRKRQQIVEEKCGPPSPRCNMTLVAHPEQETLIMFGGEYFNGSKTFLYNDLFYYNIRANEWSQIKAPNTPAPRCSHQAVVLHQSGGEMWIFGGEFSSPTQSQFYHYRDLWVFNLRDQTWQKINASGGPSSRSGHRMVACKKMIFVFGGFHDNTRDFKYFNDIYAFNAETLKWMKLEISGIPPSPRSGCVMAATQDGNHVIIYGGYSKEHVKKEVEKGQTHTDMFMLSVDNKSKQEINPLKWKWTQARQSGSRPSPRCSSSMTVIGNNRALLFGGVFDVEEDEESVKGTFYNEMYILELDKACWHQPILRKKKDDNEPKKRRRKVKASDEASSAAASKDAESELSEIDDDVKKMKVCDGALERMDADEDTPTIQGEQIQNTDNVEEAAACDDDIFTVEFKNKSQHSEDPDVETNVSLTEVEAFVPSPRMNPLLTLKNGQLFLYGGTYEDGDRQVTFSDFYSIDIIRMNEWKVIIQQDLSQMDWQDSESSDEDNSDSDEEGAKGRTTVKDAEKVKEKDEEEDSDETEEDEDDDSESEDDEDPAPPVEPLEGAGPYFDRTKEYWMRTAEKVAKAEKIDANAKQMKKAATGMAKDFWKQQQKKTLQQTPA